MPNEDLKLDLEGLHAKCRVHTADVEPMAMSQIYEFLNCPAFHGCDIRVMPDVHAGSGAVIGFTSKIGPGLCPNVVGVDIGCGVQTADLGRIDWSTKGRKRWFEWFDQMLRASVPSGFNIRNNPYSKDRTRIIFKHFMSGANVMGNPLDLFEKEVEAVANKIGTEFGKVWRAIGTLGGGNHFIEIDEDEDGHHWLTVHSGSRNFGLRVAEFHQHRAVAQMGKRGGLEWLEGSQADEYLHDMRVAQRFAMLNRLVMLDALTQGLDLELKDLDIVTSVHNFIGDDDIIRKGAISAKDGEMVVIPWNMRDGLVVGRGKGNPDWNFSAPHGSGRKMARGKAKRELDVEEFKSTMKDVWSSCVGRSTLDESPMAYKPTESIRDAIGDTVEIVKTMKPIYNFKAGGE